MRKNRHKRENCWEREAMKTDEWRYYHRAVIPRTPPHVVPDLRPIEEGSIWKIWGRGRPLLARWVTDFDCGYETNCQRCSENGGDLSRRRRGREPVT